MTGKLWGGRFTGETDPLMEAFNASIGFDQRLWRADIAGSQAYARALARAGIVSEAEAEQIVQGLEQVAAEWADGRFELAPGDEDIHTANERRLTELAGPVAGKLHTGRSRNDQIATDMRLWLREQARMAGEYLRELIAAAVERAAQEIDLFMPGYTHLQPAQPVRWSQWLLSYAWMWQRDAQRLAELSARANRAAVGQRRAGRQSLRHRPGCAGRGLGLRRLARRTAWTASATGISWPSTLFWASMTMVHLSRFAEDLILFSSREFGYVTLADAYSTGSSLMPQKKNPDAMELVRGKTGRVAGSLIGVLMTLKGLPSTYNKDLQEDKEPLFDAVDTVNAARCRSRPACCPRWRSTAGDWRPVSCRRCWRLTWPSTWCARACRSARRIMWPARRCAWPRSAGARCRSCRRRTCARCIPRLRTMWSACGATKRVQSGEMSKAGAAVARRRSKLPSCRRGWPE